MLLIVALLFMTLLFTKIQDYPSVGQLIQKARDNNINVIFVIGGMRVD